MTVKILLPTCKAYPVGLPLDQRAWELVRLAAYDNCRSRTEALRELIRALWTKWEEILDPRLLARIVAAEAALAALPSFPLAIANGGTGAITAALARVALGLEIGVNVQAFDAFLLSLAALGTTADRILYTTAVDTAAETPLTAFMRTLLDDANAAAAQTTLGLVIGTNVQAFDAKLSALVALTWAADKVPYFTSASALATTNFTASGRDIVSMAIAAKGDLLVGRAASQVGVLTIGGTKYQVPYADSAQTLGIAWGTPPQPVTYSYISSAATAVGARTVGLINSTAATARISVPSGKTFTILHVSAGCENGATAGTYKVKAVIYNHTDATETTLGTFANTAENVTHWVEADGTLAVPLGTIATGKAFSIGWANDATSPGALSTGARTIFVTGVYV